MASHLCGGGGIIDACVQALPLSWQHYRHHKMPKKWLVPLPPVVVNLGIIVGYILNYLYGLPLLITIWAELAAGQIIACYGFGYPI